MPAAVALEHVLMLESEFQVGEVVTKLKTCRRTESLEFILACREWRLSLAG